MTVTYVTPLSIAADILDPTPHPYANDPIGWANSHGIYLWEDQKAICRSVVEHRYTVAQSCHDIGKSFVSAVLVCWWLDTHPVGEAFVVTTAPTDPQVKAILWREIERLHRRIGLQGRVTMDAKWHYGAELIAYGRKPANYAPGSFSGIHARYILVVIDEGCAVPKALYDAVDSLATNVNARVLAIGNPDSANSHFYIICKPGSGWNKIQSDALRTPNFTKERTPPAVAELMAAEGISFSTEQVPDDLRDLLVSPEWVEERMKRWTVGTPLWDAKVRGKFPLVSDDMLIEPLWVEAAIYASIDPDVADAAYGCDIARYGDDKTCVYLREGKRYRLVKEWSKKSTMTTAGRLLRYQRTHIARAVLNVDDDGVGGGVTDRLVEQGANVMAVRGGLPATKPDEYVNRRSEWYWTARLLLEAGEVDLDPDDDILHAQLLTIKYDLDSRGRIVVESKVDMKKRKVASPDHADAFVYSIAHGESVQVPSHTEEHGPGTVMAGILDEPW